jgi:hypothetical protein
MGSVSHGYGLAMVLGWPRSPDCSDFDEQTVKLLQLRACSSSGSVADGQAGAE